MQYLYALYLIVTFYFYHSYSLLLKRKYRKDRNEIIKVSNFVRSEILPKIFYI